MLVIKMLKKAANMNNSELANYLGKTRNTIASWEENENNIPMTEKIKLSQRFNFVMNYWDIGLDWPDYVYQGMYSCIKRGYLKDQINQQQQTESRIEEILMRCDCNNDVQIERTYNNSYVEVINNSSNERKQEEDPRIAIYFNEIVIKQDEIQRLKEIIKKYESIIGENIWGYTESNEEYEIKLERLKKWRTKISKDIGVKPFQILSDQILEDSVKAYLSNNKELWNIKNFPVNGIKYQTYKESIIKILEER